MCMYPQLCTNKASNFPPCGASAFSPDWQLVVAFVYLFSSSSPPPPSSRSSPCRTWVMSCFHGKDGIVYGKAGQELAMSQSRRFQNVRNGDGSPSWVWSGSGWPRCRSGLRPEMTPRWANYGPLEPGRKKCRILFVKCYVVKLWRVLHCFQEERLNSLCFHFPPSPPLDSCCILGIMPLDGDKRQGTLTGVFGQTAP